MTWPDRLRDLSERVRRAVWEPLSAAAAAGELSSLCERLHEGVGDWTYGIDVPSEQAVDAWLEENAREGPLSLFSEDAGWRHVGPGGPLPGFDHGGPRVVIDPIDGTRNLMMDLRSAWTVIGFAPPGPEEPRLSDLTGGLLGELPTSRAARYRRLEAGLEGSGARVEERDVGTGALVSSRPLRVDASVQVDGGYFSVFRYAPKLRPSAAAVEERFLARLAEHEGADVATCFDDQYISSGGQLALLALGVYRMICDPRSLLAERLQVPAKSALPFDVSGAVVVARAAGCVVEALAGGTLDVPLDATTPVGFVGWANGGTADRLGPHLRAALGLGATSPSS